MNDASPEMLSIFCAALERGSAEERAAYLAAACGPDAQSRARVEALLRAHDQARGFLPEICDATAGSTRGVRRRQAEMPLAAIRTTQPLHWDQVLNCGWRSRRRVYAATSRGQTSR